MHRDHPSLRYFLMEIEIIASVTLPENFSRFITPARDPKQGENHEKKMIPLFFFKESLGQNQFKNVPTIALIIFHQSGAPPTTPSPFSNLFPIFIFLQIFPTPATTCSAPPH